MGSYDFILDGLKFSYSSATSFNTCPYSFKMTYIDSMPRANNFFAEYGILVHKCFENYFNGTLDAMELSEFYEKEYDEIVKTPAPATPYGMEEKYKNQGRDFFDRFFFPINDYEVISTEDKIDFMFEDSFSFTARPDLVLKRKKDKKNILYDFKTSMPFRESYGKEIVDKKKMNEYQKQMYLYAHALKVQKGIEVQEINLWFPRANRIETEIWNPENEAKALAWIRETIAKIKNEENFAYNNSNPYFCNELCSVRNFCEYK